MRLISDDGTVDVPYEKSAIYCSDGCISAIFNDRSLAMASYSSIKKCEKAMEMLRDEYDYVRTFETICNGSTNYPNLPSYIFQFPKDEEIEV